GRLTLKSRKIFFCFAAAYLIFVVYGSLVPLDFRPRSLESALRDFSQIPYLELGLESRADWVANLILYIPLPFLWLGALSRERKRLRQAILSIVVLILCCLLS